MTFFQILLLIIVICVTVDHCVYVIAKASAIKSQTKAQNNADEKSE